MFVYALRLSRKSSLLKAKSLVQLPIANKFWEPDKRGGYDTEIKLPLKEKMRVGMKVIGPEVNKFQEEVKTKFRMDSIIIREPGDYEKLWKFDNKDTINEWNITCDSEHNEGYSSGELVLGKNKTGIFKGFLDAKTPKDGITKYAGYASMKSPQSYKSFNRQISYDWTSYNNLMVRCRGDGRSYMLVMHINRYYDVQWHDQYHYPLYTRGGPYWQTTFLPFNKFYMTGKGRVQNKQDNFITELDRIGSMGITIADANTGPFNLEIDYIGLYYDESMNEGHAYEMYQTESYKVTD